MNFGLTDGHRVEREALSLESQLLDGYEREPGHNSVLNCGEAVLVLQNSDKYVEHRDS